MSMDNGKSRRFGSRVVRVSVLIGLLLTISAWGCATPDLAVPADRTGKLKEDSLKIFAEFQTRLKTELMTALKQGSPVTAISRCREASPGITAAMSRQGVLKVRRVSLKPRNPAHTPDSFEKGVLENWRKELASGRSPQPVAQREGVRFRVMKPIVITVNLCLRCHGPLESIDPAVRERISRDYPDDRAVGYKNGELRGAFSAIWEKVEPDTESP